MIDYRLSEIKKICDDADDCYSCIMQNPEHTSTCMFPVAPREWEFDEKTWEEKFEEEYPGLVSGATFEDDQAIKADAGKLPLTLVPREIIKAIAVIRRHGAIKYHDPDNWKKVSVERYRDAAFRHFLAYLDDPTGNDEESGLPHLWHLATNIAFLIEMEKGNEHESI